MGIKGKTESTKKLVLNGHDNKAFKEDDGTGSEAIAEKYSKVQNVGIFTYPKVCSYCKSLWDEKGNTDLISPCSCSDTTLHVHESCLESWLMNSGKVRCDGCRAVYSIRNLDELRGELNVQRVNFCLIALLMPLGVVVIVGACVLWDSITLEKAKAERAGDPVLPFGIPTGEFIILVVILSILTIGGIIKGILIMRGKKLKTLDNITVTKA